MTMSLIKPDLIANIQLRTTDEGGRKGPTLAEYLRCIFGFQAEFFDCQLLLQDVGPLYPGTAARVPIAFLNPQLIKDRLRPGDKFILREVQTIAEGVVEQLV
jgi:hypothetical protein